MLKITNKHNSTTFIADTDGIIKLKERFVLSKPKFLYLRKGEDIGADIISIIYGVALNIDWNILFDGISAGCALYTVLKLRKEKKFKEKYLRDIDVKGDYSIRDFRILCTRNKTTVIAEKINRKLEVKVKFVPAKNTHKYRFYLTNKEYVFFIRIGERKKARFLGHLGDDKQMIKALKDQFIKEWKKA